MTSPIPFNKPAVTGQELAYIQQAIASGHLAGNGPFTRRAERLLEEATGAGRALLTPSCTHALELSAMLLDLQPGDEVIVPAFTFVSTANAFVVHGARVVFADCRADTLNLDEKAVEALLTPRTRAVVAMHYAGVACEMEALLSTTRAADVTLVEDNAHGLFGRYRGRALGTFGDLATQSFHETKNITCGEGGALLLNHERYRERAEVLREKGTDRSRFFRGQVDKYTWVDVGSNFLMSELQAAYLCAQLEHASAIQERRQAIWNRYASSLADWMRDSGARAQVVPPGCEHPSHAFVVVMPSHAAQQRLIGALRERSILAVFHYLPLNTSRMGQRLGGYPGQCPVAESVSERIVRLPLYEALTPHEQDAVIEAVTSVRG